MNNLNTDFAKAVKDWQTLHLKWLRTLRSADVNAELDAYEKVKKARVKVEKLRKGIVPQFY